MKVYYILPLVAAGSALVLLPEQVLSEVEVKDNHGNGWFENVVSEKDRVISSSKQFFDDYFEELTETSQNAWSQITEYSSNALDEAFDPSQRNEGPCERQALRYRFKRSVVVRLYRRRRI